jgi:hypothetical protein
LTDPAPLSNQPRSRGTVLYSFREAALELFGEAGLGAIAARLPPEVRAATIDEPPLAIAWYPTTHIMAWWEAVLAGPCAGDAKRFDAFLAKSNEHGFGRVRRALLSFVGPEGLVSRAAELWRHDHTHGQLEIIERRPNGVRAALRHHPFTTTPLGRRAASESIRSILTLARGVRKVTSQHLLAADGALIVHLEWE